ncbi:MAG: hypothetical protein SPE38_00400 [Prevotella sp.]|nr:hypothetical protein [Prevotella sp.]
MREACCLRLMQADGMNDNLTGNPAMPPPTGTTVPDGEGITDSHPSALPAAGTEITSSHPSACFQQQPISPDSCQGCPGDISVYIKV